MSTGHKWIKSSEFTYGYAQLELTQEAYKKAMER